jgi:drug/metabolite transporter (DMT)-like permease
VFAVFFGALFIGEQLTRPMIIGGVVVLLGTALSTGLLKFRE